MKVSSQKPPCWEKAHALFKLEEKKTAAIFTYGDTIYNPFGVVLDAELIRHEETHMEQQEGHPDVAKVWWDRYVQDPEFRLDMETEAYGAQYRLYCQQVKDRNKRARYLFIIAGHLSGPMYGNIIDRKGATEAIRTASENVQGE